jgi:hypothetical protein
MHYVSKEHENVDEYKHMIFFSYACGIFPIMKNKNAKEISPSTSPYSSPVVMVLKK